MTFNYNEVKETFHKEYFNIILAELLMKKQIKLMKQNKNIILNTNGIENEKFIKLGIQRNKFCYKSIRMLANINNCIKQIKILYDPIKQFNEDSYCGKHYVENFRRYINENNDNYISNGEFIVAMLISGYNYKYINGPNILFNAKRNKAIIKKIYKYY